MIHDNNNNNNNTRKKTKRRRYSNNNSHPLFAKKPVISSSSLCVSSSMLVVILIVVLQFPPSFGFVSTGVSSGAFASSHKNKNVAITSVSSRTTTTESPRQEEQEEYYDDEPKLIPITVLSGFLGSGKTTLLQNLLNNKEGLKIAVVVNDFASINIDSKLVTNSNNDNDNSGDGNNENTIQRLAGGNIVELQNGCACCSLSDEMLASVSELITLNDMKQNYDDDENPSSSYDHIVIEMSGVSDPKGIRTTFQEAVLYDMPLMERVRLDTMVTLVDCSVFLDYLSSSKTMSPDQLPELFYRDGKAQLAKEQEQGQEDDWKNSLPPSLWDALNSAGCNNEDEMLQDTGVSEILVSQSETSDIVLLNKVDLVSATNNNNNENENETSPLIIQQTEDIIQAINPRATIFRTTKADVPYTSILGVMGPGNGVAEAGIIDDHRDAITAAAKDDNKEKEVFFSTTSHPKRPRNNNKQAIQHTAGIGTYVYQARRPFHPGRLQSTFLGYLPGQDKQKEEQPPEDEDEDDSSTSFFRNILRSKGFVWFANSHVAAFYWSHAGKSFEMNVVGRWWATLPRSQWPPEATESILQDFDDIDHTEEEDDDDEEGTTATTTTVGDRRQEIVFIGPKLNQKDKQDQLCACLDRCLLNDEEWRVYRQIKSSGDNTLDACFPNDIESRVRGY